MLVMLTMLPPAHVVSMACNACGPECANACGTAMFRACCFNYNKKRSAPTQNMEHLPADAVANLSEGLDNNPWMSENSGDTSIKMRYPKPYLAYKWAQLLGKLSDRSLNKHESGGDFFY